MKTLPLVLLSLLSISLNAQNMKEIRETVAQLFIATDNQEWDLVEQIFADEVVLDYSSMNGNPAVTLSPEQITDSWKSILPGFDATHHQIGNCIINQEKNTAEVFCYGTATHYLEHASRTDGQDAGNVWTVVGSYNFKLEKVKNEWKITHMTFNFKYQDGNTGLPQAAINQVTNSQK